MMIDYLPFSWTFRRVDALAGVVVNIGRQSRWWWWITNPFFRWMVMMMMMMRRLDDEEPSPSSGGWLWWWWDIPFFRLMSMMIDCLPFSWTFRRVDASAGVGVNIDRQSRWWWWITIRFFRWNFMMMMMMRRLGDEEPSHSSGGGLWWWWDIPFFRWMSLMIDCLPFSGTFRRVDASASVGVNIGRQSKWWWITIPFFRLMVMMVMMCHPLFQVDGDVRIRRLFVAWSATTLLINKNMIKKFSGSDGLRVLNLFVKRILHGGTFTTRFSHQIINLVRRATFLM